MKILVTVKEVAEVRDNFEISGTEIDDRYLEYDLNEWDDYAIEEAVQLKENGPATEVVTVTIGPERSEETIRMALAKGADRAVRIWDDALENISMLDIETKTNLLQAVVEEEDPDLILGGVQSGDDALSATGVSLADKLGFQWGAVVNEINYDPDENVAYIHRELEGGVEELTNVDLPAVFTIQSGINEPRYASLRGIRQAQTKEIASKSLDDIGLNADAVESDLTLTSMYEPESESDIKTFDGEPNETAEELAEVLREKEVAE